MVKDNNIGDTPLSTTTGKKQMTLEELKKMPRATFRVYGPKKIKMLNEISEARGMKPSELVAEWIVSVHDDMREQGWFEEK